MIGNDIVDLKLARKENKSENPRYLQKVFSEKEIISIQNANDPELALWRLWSMKETTYKAHQRNTSFQKILNPIQYQCELASGTVTIDNTSYQVSTDYTSAYVHSYISSEKFELRIFRTQPDLNEKIILLLSEANARSILEIEYFKNAKGLPVYGLQNSNMQTPLSLSHHGNFAAIVFALINS